MKKKKTDCPGKDQSHPDAVRYPGSGPGSNSPLCGQRNIPERMGDCGGTVPKTGMAPGIWNFRIDGGNSRFISDPSCAPDPAQRNGNPVQTSGMAVFSRYLYHDVHGTIVCAASSCVRYV